MQHATIPNGGHDVPVVAGHQAQRAGAGPHASVLLERASAGDKIAWDNLVDRYAGLVWAIACAHGLDLREAAAVNQVTWLCLADHLGSPQEPPQVGEWLATTTRRESLRMLELRGREAAATDESDLPRGQQVPAAATRLDTTEREARLRHAFAALPERCQQLLRLLLAEPPPSDAEIAAALGTPIASIGPTRASCLDCLRRGIAVDVRA